MALYNHTPLLIYPNTESTFKEIDLEQTYGIPNRYSLAIYSCATIQKHKLFMCYNTRI